MKVQINLQHRLFSQKAVPMIAGVLAIGLVTTACAEGFEGEFNTWNSDTFQTTNSVDINESEPVDDQSPDGNEDFGVESNFININNEPSDQLVTKIRKTTVKQDALLDPSHTYGVDSDGNGKVDTIVVGTKGDIGLTKNDGRIVLEDRELKSEFSYGIDVDNDKVIDVVVVGTGGLAELAKKGKGIIVEDPEINDGQSYGVDVDNDWKADIFVKGTRTDSEPVANEDAKPEDEKKVDIAPKPVVNDDPHGLCEKPEGGFQCGQHMQWWQNNHKHVEITAGPSDSTEEPAKPKPEDKPVEPEPIKKEEKKVDFSESRVSEAPIRYTPVDSHGLCEKPEGGFQCGQHMQWWQNNHKHVTIEIPVKKTESEYVSYKYEDTLKAYDDPENADTDGNGVIDNYEAIEYAKRLAAKRAASGTR